MNTLVHGLSMYRKELDINVRFLQALPNTYSTKVTTMVESRDLSSTSFDIIYGVLRTWDWEQRQAKETFDKAEKGTALVTEDEEKSRKPTKMTTSKDKRVLEVIKEETKEERNFDEDDTCEIDENDVYT